MSNKLTSDKLLSLAWEQSQMISDPYQKATIYLEMAELLYEKESDKHDCDCEKEFSDVKPAKEKKKSSKEALKPAAEKAAEPIEEIDPDEPEPEKQAEKAPAAEDKETEKPAVSASVSEIDDTWTDAMYEKFKEQYDSIQNDIARWGLPSTTVANIVKNATQGAWQPKGDISNVDMKTREGFEKVGILPRNVRLIYSFMEAQKNKQKSA